MSSSPTYKIVITDYFKKQLKRFIKKNRSLIEVFKKSLLTFQKENFNYEELTWHLEKIKQELQKLI